MFCFEEKISKKIIALNEEDEFQIRYIRDEGVGIITSRSNKSYFILDSKEYWYDLIQEQYPGKQRCSCKNDFFKMKFDYVPREGTNDFRSVELVSQCTECGKVKSFARIDIDYSPSRQLFEQPISFCEQPKIKYKTYSISGYWKGDGLLGLVEYLSRKQCLIYLWYWEKNGKRCFRRVDLTELTSFLSAESKKYLEIYFSLEPLETVMDSFVDDDDGIYVDRSLWRKKEVIKVNAPITVMGDHGGELYYMDFCSEHIDSEGKIKTKSQLFCQLTGELLKYSKEYLK